MTNGSLIQDYSLFLSCFVPLREKFPEMEFTNIASTGKYQTNRVYIYLKSGSRSRNVLFEIKYLTRDKKLKIYMKRDLMSLDEYSESLHKWNKTTETRGRIIREWSTQQELFDFLIPRIEKAITVFSS